MDEKKIYQAVSAFALVFVLLSVIWKVEWAAVAGLCVIAVCLLVPALALLVAKGWYALADVLGRINSFILMTVLFWVFVMPISLVRKALRKAKPETDSTFKDVNKTYTIEDFERPW
jgi:ABC-type uncharacterized transport system YnjBCD permease subunit